MNKAMQFKAKIKNLAFENHISAQAVLQNFMLERLLERISISKYKDKFILKGGLLIASLVGISSRTTMDMDATLRGYPISEESLREALLEICAIPLEDDVKLVLERIVPIRDDDAYGGYRASIIARFEAINTPLKVDITSGDVITPDAIQYAFPSNFENDKLIHVWAYNAETILAEKVETILSRGVLNTRPRDFYDVYVMMLTQKQTINNEIFTAALRATCEKRTSLAVLDDKEKILQAIRADETMKQRWERYCKDNYYAKGIAFDEAIAVLINILQ